MKRQDNIRKALNSFLLSSKPPESPSEHKKESATRLPVHIPVYAPEPASMNAPPSDYRMTPSEALKTALSDLQVLLRQNGIEADMEEIHQGILEALVVRPLLCRGLLAAYFLDV